MRRLLFVLALAVLIGLAGCQIPGMGQPANGPSTDQPGQQTPTATMTGSPDQPTEDPSTDRLGWENGYWANESVSVTAADGLNDTEQEAVVSRGKARVERVRQLEFNGSVPVEVINRSTYRNETGGNESEALVQFDNAKFEAMFLVGEENGSIEEQEQNRGSTVAGYYSTTRDAIVLVSESANPVVSSERTLGHELTHALQDQQFGLNNSTIQTRDAYQGRNGLVEGSASFTEERYMSNCGVSWSCISTNVTSGNASANATGGDSGIHLGLYILQYFPYSEGPNFVESLYERGGWAAVNDAFANLPDSSTEVIDAERYPDFEPANVSVEAVGGDWTQISPPDRPDYGVLGQSAITASQGYTLYDDFNQQFVVSPTAFLNQLPNGSVDFSQPFNYSISAADGWAGGRFVAFENSATAEGNANDSEYAYVWRTKWDSATEARQFASSWARLIQHWGGQQVAENTSVIDSGPYADAFRVTVSDSTVTIVNAPERGDLTDFESV